MKIKTGSFETESLAQLTNGRSKAVASAGSTALPLRAGFNLGQIRRNLGAISLTSILSAVAFCLCSCSSAPKVYSQSTPGADYSHYRTFALMPLPTESPVSDPGLMQRVSEPARQAAVDSLTAKGLTQTDRSQADIAVNLKGKFLPKTKATDWAYTPLPTDRTPLGSYAGGDRYRGQDVTQYEERTLTIEVFDNRSKQLVWTGWGKRDATSGVDVEKLKASIASILSKFPAGPAASSH